MNNRDGIAGIPHPDGIVQRFNLFISHHRESPGAELLDKTLQYCTQELGMNPEDTIFEWAEAVIGDQYPMPDRILNCAEPLLRHYVANELCCGIAPRTPFDLFATEGGTAAMCYIFDSLQANLLLKKGDRIALMTPIFTPYIEIPALKRFSFDVIQIKAASKSKNGLHTWQYPDEEIDKLKDRSIKMLFTVNPSNPPSYAISQPTLEKIRRIVKIDNPNLMILTDDVYAPYVNGFRSLMAELPENTIGVYSFSKYFGATGWRLAVIALNQNNIYDKLIAGLSEPEKAELTKRYQTITLEPEKMPFIDRLVADSRLVALNHTAGLSTPQQMQMILMASSSLLDQRQAYRKQMQSMISSRLSTLWEATGFSIEDDPLRAGYYSEIDIMLWAERLYGKKFAKYLKDNYNPLDFLVRLAKQTCIVLLNGSGFDGPQWSIRVSLANLNREEYEKIGTAIAAILEEYTVLWKKS
jgi:aspartate 4-decarboxylase